MADFPKSDRIQALEKDNRVAFIVVSSRNQSVRPTFIGDDGAQGEFQASFRRVSGFTMYVAQCSPHRLSVQKGKSASESSRPLRFALGIR